MNDTVWNIKTSTQKIFLFILTQRQKRVIMQILTWCQKCWGEDSSMLRGSEELTNARKSEHRCRRKKKPCLVHRQSGNQINIQKGSIKNE